MASVVKMAAWSQRYGKKGCLKKDCSHKKCIHCQAKMVTYKNYTLSSSLHKISAGKKKEKKKKAPSTFAKERKNQMRTSFEYFGTEDWTTRGTWQKQVDKWHKAGGDTPDAASALRFPFIQHTAHGRKHDCAATNLRITWAEKEKQRVTKEMSE